MSRQTSLNMYYHSLDIDQEFRCSSCKEEFSDVVKSICGESICGDCNEDILTMLPPDRKFKCPVCPKTHQMPQEGLPDSKVIGRMLKRRRIEKPLTEHEKRLKSELATVKDKLETLQSFDRTECIQAHCDELEFQVLDAFESTFKRLQEMEQDLTKEIQSYRAKLLEASVSKSHNQFTSDQIVELLNKWEDYFSWPSTVPDDVEISSAVSELNGFARQLSFLKAEVKRELFQGRLMVFKPNLALLEHKKNLQRMLNLQFQFESIQGKGHQFDRAR